MSARNILQADLRAPRRIFQFITVIVKMAKREQLVYMVRDDSIAASAPRCTARKPPAGTCVPSALGRSSSLTQRTTLLIVVEMLLALA